MTSEEMRLAAVEKYNLPDVAKTSPELLIACEQADDLDRVPWVFFCEWDCGLWDWFERVK